jgi:hypothetical protein
MIMLAQTISVEKASSEPYLLRQLILEASVLASHIYADLDGIVSLLLAKQIRASAGKPPAEVLFIQANTSFLEEGVLALDMGEGRGVQRLGDGYSIKASALGGSATMAVLRCMDPEDHHIFRSWAKAVSNADEGRNIHTQTMERHGDLYEEEKSQIKTTVDWFTHGSLMRVMGDYELLYWWEQKFRGMLVSGRIAKVAAEQARIAEFLYHNLFAILPENASSDATKFVTKAGAVIVTFSASMGGNRWKLGLTTRSNFINFATIGNRMLEEFPDIFVDQRGRLIGWTAKGPLCCTRKEYEERKAAFLCVAKEEVLVYLKAEGFLT